MTEIYGKHDIYIYINITYTLSFRLALDQSTNMKGARFLNCAAGCHQVAIKSF